MVRLPGCVNKNRFCSSKTCITIGCSCRTGRIEIYVSPFSLDREMGFSRREFFKILPRMLSSYDATISTEGASITLGSGCARITVGDECERRLSALVILPILHVTIRFSDVTESDKAKFLQRFDHAYMKGLG